MSLVPYTYHTDVIRFAVRKKTGVVTTGYTIGEIHDKGRKVREGRECIQILARLTDIITLPVHLSSPSSPIARASCPRTAPRTALQIRLVLPRGPLRPAQPGRFLNHAQPTVIPGGGIQLMQSAAPIQVRVRGLYDIPEAEEVLRGTLWWGGWLVEGGDDVGGGRASLAAIASLLPGDKITRDQVVSCLRWIGFLGAEKATVWAPLLDTLCARLEELMRYEQGEQDMIVLQHRFGVQ
ncbi:hypothetical protein BU17DRAFT_60112 [Hysterangium stoloniferum]|nr:hypothetical protein BU17DRAFT_60112 [Hysterangium stoloniferum]